MKKDNIPVTYIFVAINLGFFVLQILGLISIQGFGLLPIAYLKGQYYRIITAAFMHSGLYHLLCNMVAFCNTGLYCEAQTSRKSYLMAILLSMLSSGLAVLFFSNAYTIGFSGVVFGIMGYFMVILYKNDSRFDESEKALLARMLIPNIIISLTPGVSWQAHFGGFIGGVLAGILFID